MQELLSLLGLGGGGLLAKEAYDKLGDIGEEGFTQGREIGQEAADMANFTGYGVTGPSGAGSVDASGNMNLALGAGQQGMMDAYGDASMGSLGQATMDQSGREGAIYDRIRAMQAPGEQRSQLELENRMQQQGRGGISTAAYGGTPEQLAMHQANAEARNSAAYQSIDQARAQQQQDAGMSNMFGQLQFAPQSALLDLMGAGQQAYGYKDIGQRQGANMFAEGAMGGLDARLGAGLGQANLMGNLGSSMLSGAGSMLGGVASGGGDFFGNLMESIGL